MYKSLPTDLANSLLARSDILISGFAPTITFLKKHCPSLLREYVTEYCLEALNINELDELELDDLVIVSDSVQPSDDKFWQPLSNQTLDATIESIACAIIDGDIQFCQQILEMGVEKTVFDVNDCNDSGFTGLIIAVAI